MAGWDEHLTTMESSCFKAALLAVSVFISCQSIIVQQTHRQDDLNLDAMKCVHSGCDGLTTSVEMETHLQPQMLSFIYWLGGSDQIHVQYFVCRMHIASSFGLPLAHQERRIPYTQRSRSTGLAGEIHPWMTGVDVSPSLGSVHMKRHLARVRASPRRPNLGTAATIGQKIKRTFVDLSSHTSLSSNPRRSTLSRSFASPTYPSLTVRQRCELLSCLTSSTIPDPQPPTLNLSPTQPAYMNSERHGTARPLRSRTIHNVQWRQQRRQCPAAAAADGNAVRV
ncbi:hypothetical protein KC363_g18 [Hortaea werneckii]|nr:hypothetical protein KC363_g18 [Hortaea werneckii]